MDYAEAAVLHTYNRFPVVFEKGQGVYLEDLEGKRYLDFGAGIAVLPWIRSKRVQRGLERAD